MIEIGLKGKTAFVIIEFLFIQRLLGTICCVRQTIFPVSVDFSLHPRRFILSHKSLLLGRAGVLFVLLFETNYKPRMIPRLRESWILIKLFGACFSFKLISRLLPRKFFSLRKLLLAMTSKKGDECSLLSAQVWQESKAEESETPFLI